MISQCLPLNVKEHCLTIKQLSKGEISLANIPALLEQNFFESCLKYFRWHPCIPLRTIFNRKWIHVKCLKQQGFLNFPTMTSWSLWDPMALEVNKRVTLSLTFLKPGAELSLLPSNVYDGRQHQNNTVSSQLYICSLTVLLNYNFIFPCVETRGNTTRVRQIL